MPLRWLWVLLFRSMCVLSVVIWSSYSLTINGKLQTVIQAFANALEVIPRQLSENAGFNGIEIMNLLRNKHANTVCIFVVTMNSLVSLLVWCGRRQWRNLRWNRKGSVGTLPLQVEQLLQRLWSCLHDSCCWWDRQESQIWTGIGLVWYCYSIGTDGG